MTKYYYHKSYAEYFAVEDDDFEDVGIEKRDCEEVSKEEYDESFTERSFN